LFSIANELREITRHFAVRDLIPAISLFTS
jgi:hypothetical protein